MSGLSAPQVFRKQGSTSRSQAAQVFGSPSYTALNWLKPRKATRADNNWAMRPEGSLHLVHVPVPESICTLEKPPRAPVHMTPSGSGCVCRWQAPKGLEAQSSGALPCSHQSLNVSFQASGRKRRLQHSRFGQVAKKTKLCRGASDRVLWPLLAEKAFKTLSA